MEKVHLGCVDHSSGRPIRTMFEKATPRFRLGRNTIRMRPGWLLEAGLVNELDIEYMGSRSQE